MCLGHKWILGELLDPSKNRALRFSKSSMPRAEIGKAFTIGRWQSFLVMGNGVLVFDGFHNDTVCVSTLILFKKPAQVPFIVYNVHMLLLKRWLKDPKRDETILLVACWDSRNLRALKFEMTSLQESSMNTLHLQFSGGISLLNPLRTANCARGPPRKFQVPTVESTKLGDPQASGQKCF